MSICVYESMSEEEEEEEEEEGGTDGLEEMGLLLRSQGKSQNG